MHRDDTEWQRWAECRGISRDRFFPEYDWAVDPAIIAMCDRCPVREACLEFALNTDQEFGIWGGLTEWQRQQITMTRSRVRCPDCRSSSVIEEGRFEVCLSCGLSWPV